MSLKTERRKHTRNRVKWPVTILTDKGAIEGETRDITADGVFICCKEPLPLGKTFPMGVIPPDHPMIEFTGRVIWSDLYGINEKDEAFGMGVCFVEIPEEDRRSFNEVLAGHVKL